MEEKSTNKTSVERQIEQVLLLCGAWNGKYAMINKWQLSEILDVSIGHITQSLEELEHSGMVMRHTDSCSRLYGYTDIFNLLANEKNYDKETLILTLTETDAMDLLDLYTDIGNIAINMMELSGMTKNDMYGQEKDGDDTNDEV